MTKTLETILLERIEMYEKAINSDAVKDQTKKEVWLMAEALKQALIEYAHYRDVK